MIYSSALNWKTCRICKMIYDIGINYNICPECRLKYNSKKNKKENNNGN